MGERLGAPSYFLRIPFPYLRSSIAARPQVPANGLFFTILAVAYCAGFPGAL